MLVMTPAAKKMLRKHERRERDARRGQLATDRHKALVDRVAAFMLTEWKEGRAPTKLTYEGTFIAALRSELCLAGWKWDAADTAARGVVAAALTRIRAMRPSWNEGQAIDEERFIARTRCVRCAKPLEGEQRKFCSTLCAHSHDYAVRRIHEDDHRDAYNAVTQYERRDL